MYSELAAWRTTLLGVPLRTLGMSCFGSVGFFFLSPKRAVIGEGIQSHRMVFVPHCQPLCSGWHMGGTFIHSQSVLPLPQKVSVQMRGGFVSMPAKLFSCINNSRVKQIRSFSHYAYANELKLHSNTLAKQSSELTRLRTTSTSVVFSNTSSEEHKKLSWFTSQRCLAWG